MPASQAAAIRPASARNQISGRASISTGPMWRVRRRQLAAHPLQARMGKRATMRSRSRSNVATMLAASSVWAETRGWRVRRCRSLAGDSVCRRARSNIGHCGPIAYQRRRRPGGFHARLPLPDDRPTDHVVLYKSGRKAREGAGLGGVIFMPTTTAAAVPMDARDDFFSVETMTADYQTVTIQGLITFRIADAALAVARQDFSIDIRTGRHTGEPMKQIVDRLRSIVMSACRDALGRSSLDAAPNKSEDFRPSPCAPSPPIRASGPTASRSIASLVLSVKPAPEIKKALEAKLRERCCAKPTRRCSSAAAPRPRRTCAQDARRGEPPGTRGDRNLQPAHAGIGAPGARRGESATALIEARSAADTSRERLRALRRAEVRTGRRPGALRARHQGRGAGHADARRRHRPGHRPGRAPPAG